MPQPLDAIVTVNSQMECEALGFSSLSASSSGVATSEDKDNQSKRARAEWSVNLGESASAIVVARHHHQTRSPNFDIIVLGERTIFCLEDRGASAHQNSSTCPSSASAPTPPNPVALTTSWSAPPQDKSSSMETSSSSCGQQV